jgi:hypothetical protein
MKGIINAACKNFEEGENCSNYKDKTQFYLNSANSYLEAAEAVTENNLKVSLIFLSNVSTQKANKCTELLNAAVACRIDNNSKKKSSPNAANVLVSNRIVYEPHLMRLQELNEVL